MISQQLKLTLARAWSIIAQHIKLGGQILCFLTAHIFLISRRTLMIMVASCRSSQADFKNGLKVYIRPTKPPQT